MVRKKALLAVSVAFFCFLPVAIFRWHFVQNIGVQLHLVQDPVSHQSIRTSEEGNTYAPMSSSTAPPLLNINEVVHGSAQDVGVWITAKHSDQWLLPSKKYLGASCKANHECASGLCIIRCVWTKLSRTRKPFQNPKDSVCQKYREIKNSIPTPRFVLTDAMSQESKPAFDLVMHRLDLMDQCIEDWRTTNMPSEKRCKRCHTIASDNYTVLSYVTLIRRLPSCHTVCEVGFNRGDSALVLSSACGPRSVTMSFTIDGHWYTKPGLGCLIERGILQPEQALAFVEGYTTDTITDFMNRNRDNVRCDVIHIDGDKTAWTRHADVLAFRSYAHAGTLWISDDVVADFSDSSNINDVKEQHCVLSAFSAAVANMSLSVRCDTSSTREKKGAGQAGTCYAYKDWDALLHSK